MICEEDELSAKEAIQRCLKRVELLGRALIAEATRDGHRR